VFEGVCTFTELKFTYNDIGYNSSGDFNVVSDSNFISNAIGVQIDGDDNVVLSNYFSENPKGIQVNNNSEDTRLDDNEITKSSNLGIYLYGAEETIVKNNYIHNNSGNGLHLESSHENIIYLNTLEYNSADVMVLAVQSGNSSIHNNTFKSNDESPVKVDSSYYNTFRDNVFTSNDDYFTLEGGGYNHLISNTFDDTGIQLYNSNNQFLTGNTITDAPKKGIRIFKSSSDNYLADNVISDWTMRTCMWEEAEDRGTTGVTIIHSMTSRS
jgi:parallel beta-helix repeat protein